MKPVRWFTVVVVAIVSLAALAAPFEEWRRRPEESFSQPERAFREAMEHLRRHSLDGSITEADLYRGAVEGMLQVGGRKWDSLITPSELAELQTGLSGQLVGIGA